MLRNHHTDKPVTTSYLSPTRTAAPTQPVTNSAVPIAFASIFEEVESETSKTTGANSAETKSARMKSEGTESVEINSAELKSAAADSADIILDDLEVADSVPAGVETADYPYPVTDKAT